MAEFNTDVSHRERDAIKRPRPIPSSAVVFPVFLSLFAILMLVLTNAPPEAHIVLVAGGDCLLDRDNSMGRIATEGDGRWTALLAACDPDAIFLCNLETTIGTGGTPRKKRFTFRAPPSALSPLLAFSHPVVALANNHSLDYGLDGLAETLRELDRVGINRAGAGLTKDEAAGGTIVDTGVTRVRILSFGYGDDPERNPDGFGACIAPLYRAESLAAVSSAAKDSDLTVVMLHWGVEYDTRYGQSQVSFAHALVKAGADVILGSGPHVTQGVELYHGALICYSIGNLVFDDLGNPEVSAALLIRVSLFEKRGKTERNYEIAPLRTSDPYRGPERPSDSDSDQIIRNISERSPEATIVSNTLLLDDGNLRWYRVCPRE